jgi:hypothetical protein
MFYSKNQTRQFSCNFHYEYATAKLVLSCLFHYKNTFHFTSLYSTSHLYTWLQLITCHFTSLVLYLYFTTSLTSLHFCLLLLLLCFSQSPPHSSQIPFLTPLSSYHTNVFVSTVSILNCTERIQYWLTHLLKWKLSYDRWSVSQSVLVLGSYLEPMTICLFAVWQLRVSWCGVLRGCKAWLVA